MHSSLSWFYAYAGNVWRGRRTLCLQELVVKHYFSGSPLVHYSPDEAGTVFAAANKLTWNWRIFINLLQQVESSSVLVFRKLICICLSQTWAYWWQILLTTPKLRSIEEILNVFEPIELDDLTQPRIALILILKKQKCKRIGRIDLFWGENWIVLRFGK